MDSPLDYRDKLTFRTSPSSIHVTSKTMAFRRQADGDEGMEHCLEQNDGYGPPSFKMNMAPSPVSSRKSSKKSQCGQILTEDEHLDLETELSRSSSRLTESLVLEEDEDEEDEEEEEEEEEHPAHSAKRIKVSRKRSSQRTSRQASLGDVLDQ